jgi:5-methylcytosine-specific restriction endonuclease McrA
MPTQKLPTSLTKKNNSNRVRLRNQAMKSGKVRKGDGMEIDHIKPLSKGGTFAKENMRIISKKQNRVKSSRKI